MVTQFNHTRKNPDNPELIVSSSTTGMDLVLFYIRKRLRSWKPYRSWANLCTRLLLFHDQRNPCDVLVCMYHYAFAYNIRLQASRGMFLALSMYGRTINLANTLGKVIAVLLPILFISLLQVDAIQASFLGYFALADLPRKSANPLSLFPELTNLQS